MIQLPSIRRSVRASCSDSGDSRTQKVQHALHLERDTPDQNARRHVGKDIHDVGKDTEAFSKR